MSLIPTDTLCPVCFTVFIQPQRKQGGVLRQIYCSAKCRAKDWVRKHPVSRKATILKYDNKPENKEQKNLRTRKATLKQYGWTEVQFTSQLIRQNYSCYGCLEKINKNTARIDHNHMTGVVRGLLCNSCNWGLGHVKDSPSTLRRLMAYLDYKIEKKNIYLIGALKNKRVPEIGNMLRKEGYDVMDEWFTPGEFADTNWQAYETQRGRTYIEALRGRAATNIFLFDRSYLDHCDVAILCAPAGKSAMLELGYATGREKKTILFLDGEDPERYDIMPNFASAVCMTEIELLAELKK